MAINLNPGADASLVTSATRAGLADAPPDYSKQFESVAKNYDNTMKAQAEMWGNIAMATAKTIKHVNDDINTRPPDGTEHIVGDLDESQRKMRISYGLEKNDDGKRMVPWSKEARELRREARKERGAIFKTAEHQVKTWGAIENMYTNNLVDKDMTAPEHVERSAAVIASFRGGTTANGNYAKWEEVDGEKQWVMYHDPSKIKKGQQAIDGVPYDEVGGVSLDNDGRILNSKGGVITTNSDEILQNLHSDPINKKTGVGVIKTGKADTAAEIQKMGFNSKVPFADLDAYTRAKVSQAVANESNSRASWFVHSFADPANRSFFNRVTNADGKGSSLISAEMYTELARLSELPVNEDGDLQAAGVFTGLEDPNDNGYISQKEFLTEVNMKKFGLALFSGENYDAEVTAGIYEWDQMRNYGLLFDDGHNKRTDDGGGGGDELTYLSNKKGGGIKLSSVIAGGSENAWLDSTTKNAWNNVKSNVNERSDFGNVTWNEEHQTYMLGEIIIPDKQALWENYMLKNDKNPNGQDLTKNFMLDPFWTEIKDWDGTKHPGWQSQLDNTKTETKTNTQQKATVNNNNNIKTIKDGEVVDARIHWSHIQTRRVRKTNGVWEQEVPDGYSGDKKWTKLTSEQIKKVNQQYK